MQGCDWLKPGTFRCEHEYVCVMVCVHRKLFLGTLGLCPLYMWLGRSGQFHGTGCVSALPERRVCMLRQNLYHLPVTFLESGQALPWVGPGLVGRPM